MPLDVKLLEESFAAVAPRGEELTATFYRILLTDYPQVRPLFAGVDLAEQQKVLLASLKLVVEHLRRPLVMQQALERLGARHVDYGAREEHYPAVGKTLLKSLAEISGDGWNDDLERAWAEAYAEISRQMIAGAAVPVAC